jgi:hypothetical protein
MTSRRSENKNRKGNNMKKLNYVLNEFEHIIKAEAELELPVLDNLIACGGISDYEYQAIISYCIYYPLGGLPGNKPGASGFSLHPAIHAGGGEGPFIFPGDERGISESGEVDKGGAGIRDKMGARQDGGNRHIFASMGFEMFTGFLFKRAEPALQG